MEFPGLYEEFINSDYLDSLDGMRHLDAYEEERVQGRRNFESVLEARERGEDVTDLVLLKLLPHNDTEGNRERGAWVHIEPAIQKDIKTKYEGAGWTKPEDWPAIAEAILDLLHWCNEDPELLSEACAEFAQLPYSKGFQTGMLTPILNALRPEDYLLVNDKSRRTINYFSAASNEPKVVPEGYSLVEGGKLKSGMLVRDIGGNKRDGSVPTGKNVVEEITNVLPASPSGGREYVKLALKRVDTGEERTKFLSKTKRVAAKAAADSSNGGSGGRSVLTGALRDGAATRREGP
jgi:hypothetical protein